MSKQIRTRPATKQEGQIALQKAQQFADAAHNEFANERWNSAGLNAIHCGISAADAALICAAGIRSTSQDHANVSSLLERNIASFKGNPRTQLVGLLGMKNAVAYEQRLISQSEASRLVTAADRFLTWSQGNCA